MHFARIYSTGTTPEPKKNFQSYRTLRLGALILSLLSPRECERMGFGAPRRTLLILSLFSPREWRENGLWSSEADASHSLSILTERMRENDERMRSGAPRWTLVILSIFSPRECQRMSRGCALELRGGRFSFSLYSRRENGERMARQWSWELRGGRFSFRLYSH